MFIETLKSIKNLKKYLENNVNTDYKETGL